MVLWSRQMPKNYDKIDFYWTFDEDLLIGPDGDLYDTLDDPLLSLVQEIKTRLKADQLDWDLYPDVGAELSELIGEPNNKATAETGKAKIIAALTRDGLVDISDLSVKYMPVGPDSLLYKLDVRVTPTDENYQTQQIEIKILFDYKSGNLHLL